MRIYSDVSFENFEPWSGAVSAHEAICNAGKAEQMEAILEDLYPDGMTDTELNDLLWFEPETIAEWLNLRTQQDIDDEIAEVEAAIESLMDDYRNACENATEDEEDEETIESIKSEIWAVDYEDDYNDLKERLDELNEEEAEI